MCASVVQMGNSGDCGTSALILFKYECSTDHLFVLSWYMLITVVLFVFLSLSNAGCAFMWCCCCVHCNCDAMGFIFQRSEYNVFTARLDFQ